MSMTTTAEAFTGAQAETLGILVNMIIPASEDLGLPGAGDERIMTDILATAARQREAVAAALAALDKISLAIGNLDFAKLGAPARDDAVAAFRRKHADGAGILATITTQCYYRDDQVMRSLNMAARPPFPLGFEVDQGDWSLLEPVRGSGPIYRETP